MSGDGVKSVLRLVVPSAASLVVHAGLLALVVFATISVRGRPAERGRLTDVVISSAGPAREAVAAEASAEASEAAIGAAELPTMVQPAASLSTAVARVDSSEVRSSRASGAARVLMPEAERGGASVSFAGVQAKAARRVVYVVDASGSMVSSFAFVRARLAKSIEALSPTQQFQIVLARQMGEGGATVFRPEGARAGELIRALPKDRAAAVAWMREQVVGGRPDAIGGLRAGLAFEPDVIFFLSRGFARSNTEGLVSVEGVLGELDVLNPRAGRTGLRPVVIKTIQFLDDDPTGLLEAIAEEHGDGAGSFRVLTMDDLADEGVDEAPIAGERDVREADRRRAGAVLAEVEAEARHVLLGLGTDDEAARVAVAAAEALRLLGPRVEMIEGGDEGLRARALLMRSVGGDAEDARAAAELLDAWFVVDADADAARRVWLVMALARAGERERALEVARAVVADAELLGLRAAIGAELSVVAERYGLEGVVRGSAGDAMLIEARAASKWSEGDGKAFDGLIALAEREPMLRDEIWRRVAAVTDGVEESGLSGAAVFVSAMVRAGSDVARAAESLLALAAREPRDARACDALWEASVLLQEAERERAADVLEQFVRACGDDGRMADAVRACIAWTADEAALARRLRLGLEKRGEDEAADVWRLHLAQRCGIDEALELMGEIGADSAHASAAGALVFARSAEVEDAAILERCAGLMRGLGEARWELVQVRVVEALMSSGDARAVEAAGVLDLTRAERRLVLAKAKASVGDEAGAGEELKAVTARAAQGSATWWEAWTLLLEQSGVEKDEVRAHVFRLRLIDAGLGGEPWRSRLERLAPGSVDGYTGQP